MNSIQGLKALTSVVLKINLVPFENELILH